MRIGEIVLKLRLADTRFNNLIGGAAELNLAIDNTLKQDMAFVIPLAENCPSNEYDSGINQKITERFGVIVALGNDNSQADKTGITSYDLLHTVRGEIFKALLGWKIDGAESLVYYRGGRVLDITGAYLWYQFEFEFETRILNYYTEDELNDTDGVDMGVAGLDDFNTIYTNIILSPSADLPYTGELPLSDGYPNVVLPDNAQWLDLTENPNAGDFGKGFGSGFDFYTG